MISVTVRLSQVDEALLYRSSKNGETYLNLLLTPEPDKFGQPLPKERYLRGEASPSVGSWKELGPQLIRCGLYGERFLDFVPTCRGEVIQSRKQPRGERNEPCGIWRTQPVHPGSCR